MWLELVGTYLPRRLYFPKFVETGGEKEGGNRKRERKKWISFKIKRCSEIQKETQAPGVGGFSRLCILLIRK